jgi:hypothetical protein
MFHQLEYTTLRKFGKCEQDLFWENMHKLGIFGGQNWIFWSFFLEMSPEPRKKTAKKLPKGTAKGG